MARNLSPFITGLFTAAAASGERIWRTQVALVATLASGVDYLVATGAISMTSVSRRGASTTLVDPLIFDARAISIPSLRHGLNTPPDAGEMALINLDHVISQLIPEPTRLFNGAKAKVYLCFPKADGSYEGLLYFRGLLRQVSGDDEEAPMSLISDLSSRDIFLGEEITQRCLNELGDYVFGGRCGATHLPTGATCSKDFDDIINGCSFWGQMHAFWGIPFINTTDLLSTYTGDPTDGWEDHNLHGCVDPQSYIKLASGQWIRASECQDGMELIDLRGRVGVIEMIQETYHRFRYLTIASNGCRLKHSCDHPFTTAVDDDEGHQAYTLRSWIEKLNGEADHSDSILSVANGKIELAEQWVMYPIAPGKVLRFTMHKEGTRNYVAGVNPHFGFEGHNNKGFDVIRDVQNP